MQLHASARFVKSALPLVLLLASACAKTEIVHELEEREANEIVVLLDKADPPIVASKVPDLGGGGGGGNKGPKFMITVPAAEATRSWTILTSNNLPRRKDMGLTEVFAAGGLVPTASEEKAKWLNGIQGDLARTLKSIDGVLDARVHIVIPEDSVLRVKEEDKATATASVWYKYATRDRKSPKPLTDQEVAEMVANSVEKLKPEHVKVIATTVLAGVIDAAGDPSAGLPQNCGGIETMMGVKVCRNDVNKFKGIVIGAVVMIVLITLVFMMALLKKSGGGTPPKAMARMPTPPPSEPPQ